MSQAIESVQPKSNDDFDEFDYRPVPTTAIVSMVLAALSLLSFVTTLALILTPFGIVVGYLAFRTITRSRGEYSGKKIAVCGTTLSALCMIGGIGFHYYNYLHEVPEGFQRISFNGQIAKKKFIFEDGETKIHPDVEKLNGEKIFLKGYMYPMQQKTGLTAFVLVKDNQQCCFGGQPAVTDMIEIHMQEGRTAKDFRGLTSVAGVFRVAQSEGIQQNLNPVYRIDAFHFSAPARTSF